MSENIPANIRQSLGALSFGSSEVIEIDEELAVMIPNVHPVPLTGTLERTFVDEDNRKVARSKQKRNILTPDGYLVSSLDSIVGHCVVCRDQGKQTIIAKGNVNKCAKCGVLLCKDHAVVQNGEVLCPKCAPLLSNGKRNTLLGLGLLALLGGALAMSEEFRDGVTDIVEYYSP
jgi:hypothetical protein